MEVNRTKSKKKPGEVVRVNTPTFKIIESERRGKESRTKTIERLIRGARGRTFFILPEAGIVCSSLSDARGKAILAAVMKKQTKPEDPVIVREVISGEKVS